MLSPLAARKAEKLGFTKVKVFHAGLPAWNKAGREIVSNTAAIAAFDKKDISYILLDLRDPKLVEQGHIPNAVAIKDQNLENARDQFPRYKAAPIILYNQAGNLDSAKKAYDTIRDWGYKHVSILQGGFTGWEKAGKEIPKRPAEAKINYVRKLPPGEIDIEDFKKLVANGPGKDYLILDVREEAEHEAGALPNTKSMPLTSLESKVGELPKDKKIVIHCATGARAEMAHNVLKQAGIDSKYVKANVEIDKDNDKYTIED